METFFFAIVALVAIVSGILVVKCRNPINSALSLILTFFCLATFYVMLDAPFMAAIQVIVYAGAIMVLIVFVIMLLNLRTDTGLRYTHAVAVGSIIGVLTLVEIIYFFSGGRSGLTGMQGGLNKELIEQVAFTLLPYCERYPVLDRHHRRPDQEKRDCHLHVRRADAECRQPHLHRLFP